MPTKIIHLLSRIPPVSRSEDPGIAEKSSGQARPGQTVEMNPAQRLRTRGKKSTFPPICLIEPLSPVTKGALRSLLKGEFDSSFEQQDYRVLIRNLNALNLTILLIECRSVSILTLIDADTGAAFSARIQAGEYPELESLLRQLSKLAAQGHKPS